MAGYEPAEKKRGCPGSLRDSLLEFQKAEALQSSTNITHLLSAQRPITGTGTAPRSWRRIVSAG
jgi:hypothetical protein